MELDLSIHLPQLRTKTAADGKRYIWCAIRKKWLVLQPEEWVRQLVILFLVDLGFNKNRIQVEKRLLVNGQEKRFDILVYDEAVVPHLLVECKAPSIPLSQKVLDQISLYNIALKVPYLLVTNGPEMMAVGIDFEKERYDFLTHIPLS